MAVLRGPLLSQEAHGSFSDLLTFQSLRQKPLVRKKPVPSNPRSPLQISVRTVTGFLSQEWRHLPSSTFPNWSAQAQTADLSPFNFYVRYNAQRWNLTKYPSQDYPAAEALRPPNARTPFVDGISRGIHVHATQPFSSRIWGTAFFCADQPGVLAQRECLCFMLRYVFGVTYSLIFSPLTPGTTYYYRAMTFSKDGNSSVPTLEQSATVLP